MQEPYRAPSLASGLADGAARAPVVGCQPEVETLDRIERQLRRMAFDLHDGLMQSVSVARLQAELVSELACTSECADAARDLVSALDAALAELHQITTDLRPPALDAAGLEEMLARHIEEFGASAGITTRLVIADGLPPLSTSAQIALFRIVQEALSNAAEHGAAAHAEVTLAQDDGCICCVVVDDGRGFDPEHASVGERRGMGLCGMRERAELLGGSVSISSVPGLGTSVVSRIPLWS